MTRLDPGPGHFVDLVFKVVSEYRSVRTAYIHIFSWVLLLFENHGVVVSMLVGSWVAGFTIIDQVGVPSTCAFFLPAWMRCITEAIADDHKPKALSTEYTQTQAPARPSIPSRARPAQYPQAR